MRGLLRSLDLLPLEMLEHDSAGASRRTRACGRSGRSRPTPRTRRARGSGREGRSRPRRGPRAAGLGRRWLPRPGSLCWRACAGDYASSASAVGRFPTGGRNSLVDVPGVLVGHRTLIEGDRLRTGVTAILPHDGNPYVGEGARRLSRDQRVRQGHRADPAGRARNRREPAAHDEHPLGGAGVGGRAAPPARAEPRGRARPRHAQRDRGRVLRRLAVGRACAGRPPRARSRGDRPGQHRGDARRLGRRRHGHNLFRLQGGGGHLVAPRR